MPFPINAPASSRSAGTAAAPIYWTSGRDLKVAVGPHWVTEGREEFFSALPAWEPAAQAHRSALRGEPASFEMSVRNQDYRCFADPVRNEAGAVTGVVGLAYEISEVERLRRLLAEANSSLHLAESAAHMGTFDLDVVSQSLVWSDETYRIFGLPIGSEVTTETYVGAVHPDDRGMVTAAVGQAIGFGIPTVRLEHRIIVAGAERWLEANTHPVLDGSGRVVRLFGTGTDITERKEAEAQLAFLAHHDLLTGLPNRALLVEKLSAAVAESRAAGNHIGVVFLDLDDFKHVNDSYGHAEGDRLIKICADRLRSCLRAGDIATRVGGDEFIVVLNNMAAAGDAAHTIARMQKALAEPVSVGSLRLGLRASFGISSFPDDSDAPETLIRYADLAMYRSKAAGRGTCTVFNASFQKTAYERVQLEYELRCAIENRELTVHYQPIVDGRTKRITKVEALVRWPRRDGMMEPGTFIPLAEETGLIVPLGEFVLREACKTIAELNRSVNPAIGLSVNLSPRQMAGEGLVALCRDALAQTGLAANLLDLEVTESYLMADPEQALATLNEIAALGVRIAVDDFGTGYSSLSMLRRFPVHVLKLDRSFLTEIESNPADRVIVSTILSLARALDMWTVAEGVETEEQFETLLALGCELFQGYLFGRPMTSSDLNALMSEQPPAPKSVRRAKSLRFDGRLPATASRRSRTG